MNGTVPGQRCRACSAAVRPGAPWCTQCYAPTGEPAPAAQAPLEQAPVETVQAPTVDVPTVASASPTGTWPCTACATDNPLSADACGTCGAAFLSGAHGREPLLVLPVVGDLTALPPGRRIGGALAVVAGFVVLCAVLGLLLA